MALGENLMLPAVPLNSAGTLQGKSPTYRAVQTVIAWKIPFPGAEIWLTYNQAVHLTPLEVLVLWSSADCSAKDAKREKFSFLNSPL